MEREGLRYAKCRIAEVAPSHPFAILRSQFRRGQTVLDLGCGSGDVGAYLIEAGITDVRFTLSIPKDEEPAAELLSELVGAFHAVTR